MRMLAGKICLEALDPERESDLIIALDSGAIFSRGPEQGSHGGTHGGFFQSMSKGINQCTRIVLFVQ